MRLRWMCGTVVFVACAQRTNRCASCGDLSDIVPAFDACRRLVAAISMESFPSPRRRQGAYTSGRGSCRCRPRLRECGTSSLSSRRRRDGCPTRYVGLFRQAFAEQQRGEAEAGADPDFLRLLVVADDAAVGGHSVRGAHFAIAEFHDVGGEDFLCCGELHIFRVEIAEAGHIGVPLAGELVGLDAVAIFALLVVAEIFAVPEFVDVGFLRFKKMSVIMSAALCFAERAGGFFRCAQSCQPQAAAVRADTADDPGVVGLVGIAAVFRDAAAVIELL